MDRQQVLDIPLRECGAMSLLRFSLVKRLDSQPPTDTLLIIKTRLTYVQTLEEKIRTPADEGTSACLLPFRILLGKAHHTFINISCFP